MKKTITIIAALFAATVNAGNMETNVDNFKGTSSTHFVSSTDGLLIMIFKHNETQAFVSASTLAGKLTNCSTEKFSIKTADGTIHSFSSVSRSYRTCAALVDYSYIQQKFDMRVPVYNRPYIDVSIDTSKLDWTAMGTKKISK